MPKVQGMIYGNAIQTLNENKIKFADMNINNPNNWVVIKQSVTLDEVINTNVIVTLELEPIDNDINLGDIDNNGIIDISDATMICIMYEGVGTINDFTIEQIIAADVNQDGHITYIDAQIVQTYYTYLMSIIDLTSNQEIMPLEEYYINEFDSSEYNDN